MKSERIKAKEYITIIIGVILMAASMDMFLVPNMIASGGFSGFATILHYLFSLSVGLVIITLNIPLFLVAFRKLGFIFCTKSLLAMALFSLAIDILPLPCLTHDLLLASIYGGIVMGIGSGLVLRAGATTGGTDTVAMLVIRVLKNFKVNWLIFFIDFFVILIAAFIFSPERSLYGLAVIYISSKATELILEGPNSSRMIIIMTRKSDAIIKRVLNDMKRGITHVKAKGMYTENDIDVLICVVQREAEVITIKDIVTNEDENAFLIVGSIKEVLGNGF